MSRSVAATSRPPAVTLGPLSSLRAEVFDLSLSLTCGQVFHWRPIGAGYMGTIGETAVYAEQRGDELLVSAGCESLAAHYFALDHPLERIYPTFPDDPAMQEALRFCRGLRILRQPLWECTATFITSSMKQVAHIAQMSDALRRRFGTPVRLGGEKLYAYPTPEALARAAETDLRACSLGYRAANLRRSAEMIASGQLDLEALRGLPYSDALAGLLRLPGVGVKVANCALLFAFERLEAFPIDVWIERVLREIYFAKKRRVTAGRLRAFTETYFGPYGGYAQQYLFHFARMAKRRGEPAE
jgi:N-glycosylase/DNA lyase